MSNHLIDTTIKTLQASGKLMLFGEYLVLQGADSLAIPLKFGQQLKVEETTEPFFSWKSFANNTVWFEAEFDSKCQIIQTTDTEKAAVLMKLLTLIKSEKPLLFVQPCMFEATADFDLKWGLGSSSTLISLLAQWSDVNPYFLLEKTFGGSGYDVACATVDHPIRFARNTKTAVSVRLSPAVTNKILFVYSGNKQNSKAEVKRFSALEIEEQAVQQMNQLIDKAQASNDIDTFETQMRLSENLLSPILKVEPIKMSSFKDYPYEIKSMGAWGGDFFMATFRDEDEARNYFKQKGYPTQFTYSEIIK